MLYVNRSARHEILFIITLKWKQTAILITSTTRKERKGLKADSSGLYVPVNKTISFINGKADRLKKGGLLLNGIREPFLHRL